MAQSTPPDKPLSYLSLKCVLEHMEANHRYAVVSRCPSLRNAHRHVPLTVEYLKLDRQELILNDFRHHFSYHPDKKHQYLEEPTYLKQGDIELRDPIRPRVEPQDPAHGFGIAAFLLRRTQALPVGHQGNPIDLGDSDDDEHEGEGDQPRGIVLDGQAPHPRRQVPAPPVVRGRAPRQEAGNQQVPRPRSISPGPREYVRALPQYLLRHEAQEPRVVVYPLNFEDLRQPSAPDQPKPDRVIKFTMRRLPVYWWEPENFVRLPVSMKIRNLIRTHLGNLISQNTLVRHLEVDIGKGILRIPDGLTFRIRDLSVSSQAFSLIQPILSLHTSTLNKLTLIIDQGYDHLLKNPFLHSFPKLHLTLVDPPMVMDPIFPNLPHQEVYVSNLKISFQEMCEFARTWITQNRPVGSIFSMNPKNIIYNWLNEHFLPEMIKNLNAQWKSLDGLTKCVCLPTLEQKELVIYSRQQEDTGSWILVYEVVGLGRTEEWKE